MHTLLWTSYTHTLRGNYAGANALLDELAALADEKGAALWKPLRMMSQGGLLVPAGKAADAVQMITSGWAAWLSMGASAQGRVRSNLAEAYAELGQFDDAWRCISEALSRIDTTNERWFEAEVNRVAGEVVRKSPEWDAAKAEAYFNRALSVSRVQEAKSWELGAIKGSDMRPENFLLRSTAGSPRVLTRWT
jgi:tetratricopeptide (TPR) repeat protein